MGRRLRYSLLFFLIVPLASIAQEAPVDAGFKGEVLQRASTLEQAGRLTIGAQTIHSAGLILRIYELNGYQPLWNDSNIPALRTALADLSNDGLRPEDYHFAEVDSLAKAKGEAELSTAQEVDYDLLLSEACIRAIYNLAFGKVDAESLDADINFSRPFTGKDPAPTLLDGIRNGRIAETFDLVRPKPPGYARMKQALAQYRAYQAAGGWQPVPEGKALKEGDADPRVASLRDRLRVTGDYLADSPPSSNPQLFDQALAAGVKRFQKRHGLDADGAVGPATLRALNVSVEARINQIRVNLERQRWILHEAYDELLVVDVAGFKVYWLKGTDFIWQESVQVGKHYTSTPLFKAEVREVVFNPTWTIPPGILRRSILPGIKKDPDYLTKKGFLLLTQDGKEVDPASVDWASLKGFPYIVRQPAGPNNALGLVKFMFPNPHFVFLHDTNHRELFDHTSRTFSSGCIRVRNPFDLAERLLANQGWTRERIDELIASGRTKHVALEKPMRIVIAYHTVLVRDGEILFREDVYKRDPAVLKALDGEFKVRKQDRKTDLGVS